MAKSSKSGRLKAKGRVVRQKDVTNDAKRPNGLRGASLVGSEQGRTAIRRWLQSQDVVASEFSAAEINQLIAAIQAKVFHWVVTSVKGSGLDINSAKQLLTAVGAASVQLWTAEDNECVSAMLPSQMKDLGTLTKEINRIKSSVQLELDYGDPLKTSANVLQVVLDAISEQKGNVEAKKRSDERTKKIETLNKTQRKLYDATPEKGPLTGDEIAKLVEINFNSVTKGHLSTLKKMGLISPQPGGGYLRTSLD